MKRFLTALLTPFFIVAVLNINVIWTLLKVLYWPHPVNAISIARAQAQQPDNSLAIPTLGLMAPVVGSPADPTEITDWQILRKDLTEGVSLSTKFALPGGSGTTLVLGHSSDILPHRYASVFAGLTQLQVGESISLKYQGKTYNYKVTERQIVVPTDPLFQRLKSTDKPNQLVLVTCWPLLSSAKRLVITAVPNVVK